MESYTYSIILSVSKNVILTCNVKSTFLLPTQISLKIKFKGNFFKLEMTKSYQHLALY